MKSAWALSLFATAALLGCANNGAPTAITAAVETAPTEQSDANSAIIIPHGDSALIIGSSENGGIEVFGLDGARRSATPAGSVVGLDARYGVPGEDGRAAWTIGAVDGAANALRLFELDVATGAVRERSVRAVATGFAAESMCLYRDARDQTLYAFVLGGAGEIAQYMIAPTEGGLEARPVRQLRIASEAAYCTTDDVTGDLYVSEQGVGFWRFDADPEAEVVPQLIDAARLGHVTEEAGGIAVYNAGDASYLVASDASANQFHVYDRNADHAFVGTFTVGDGDGVDGVQAAGGLNASSFGFGAGFPQGALVATDDENDGGTNYKLISWADIAGALDLTAGTARDPRTAPESNVVVVHPTMETVPVETDGDAADDPAIWVDRNDPSRSLIIGTQKQSGLYVYDLNGRVVQFLPDGRMNNVDLRDGFRLGNQTVSLVAASNRTNDGISLYRVDAATRRLVNVADGIQPTGMVDPYGLCMYRSQSGRTYVFVTDSEGPVRQWELVDAGNGRVRANRVRDIPFATQTEGCVADDVTGVLYVAEEDVGLWRVGAEPDAPATPVSIATVETNSALHDDLEGIGLYDLGGGRGYLVLSSQGDNSYAVFRREGNNEYVGSFSVLADPALGIDGISETDGLEVLSANLGGPLSGGVFIAQDGRNVSPQQYQNFKLVPWSSIAAAMNLETRR